MLTVALVEKALPVKLKGAATQELTDKLNSLAVDPEVAETIRENFLSYTKVLEEGRFRTEDYLNAVQYVTYKHMEYSNQEAYFRTFPLRYQALLNKNTSPKDIAAHVAMYHKNKLVNLIMEQSLIPIWIVNQENYQKAINRQVWLMDNAQSEMVQTTAANSVLTHLAKPKEAALNLKIDVKESSAMQELKGMLTQLAQKQQDAISSGMLPGEVAAQKLIEGTAEDVS